MRTYLLFAAISVTVTVVAQQPAVQPAITPPPTTFKVYNSDFAIAHTRIDLDLHQGLNDVTIHQVTNQLEPDSVVLRETDLREFSVKSSFRIIEQSYEPGVTNLQSMLHRHEGKVVSFELSPTAALDEHAVPGSVIEGTIVRAPLADSASSQNLNIIESNGQLRFQIPGTALFSSSAEGDFLKPTLRWQIDSPKAQKLTAELGYITRGLNWEAAYSVVKSSPIETGKRVHGQALAADEVADVVGWITISNESGTDLQNATIKSVAECGAGISLHDHLIMKNPDATGRAHCIKEQMTRDGGDDSHSYDLDRTLDLHNGESKEIPFIQASAAALSETYVYDGANEKRQSHGGSSNSIAQQQDFEVDSANTRVDIVDEIVNSQLNHLGVSLPAGNIRLYRRDTDGGLELIGESIITHTKADETLKLISGRALDVSGSRRQTDFHINQSDRTMDESFEIKLINQKSQPIAVIVNEHLDRTDSWEIQRKSADYTKIDGHSIRFSVKVPANGQSIVTYSVRYIW
ncbi:MAG: hypothetical protein ABR905_13840 [Terracidiphilus sp.]